MLDGVHFLLTYQCTSECDHCFLYCGPRAEGTFTVEQLEAMFEQIDAVGTVEWTYFEGGEPFLFYPVLMAGLQLAKARGLKTGIVTNSYWAKSERDARLWLEPIAATGLDDLSVSDDAFHHGDAPETPAALAARVARRLGLSVTSICIEAPAVSRPAADEHGSGPIVGGGVRFRGRAVDKLAAGLPGRPAACYGECPCEDLASPSRVHVDAFGNVQLCQGLSLGNAWRTPLAELVRAHDAASHPICGPLVAGGPLRLAQEHGVPHDATFVDACHLCHVTRRALVDRFPECLAPRQVYGLA